MLSNVGKVLGACLWLLRSLANGAKRDGRLSLSLFPIGAFVASNAEESDILQDFAKYANAL